MMGQELFKGTLRSEALIHAPWPMNKKENLLSLRTSLGKSDRHQL